MGYKIILDADNNPKHTLFCDYCGKIIDGTDGNCLWVKSDITENGTAYVFYCHDGRCTDFLTRTAPKHDYGVRSLREI